MYMNNIPNCTEYFILRLYVDDTALYNTVQGPSLPTIDLSKKLAKRIESIKTTSTEDVSTKVLEKIKNI